MSADITQKAIGKMIAFYRGDYHDIAHFLNVYAFARHIGLCEGLDERTQETLELAAVVHDIACPLCREKYGNTAGKMQELESPALISEFFSDFEIDSEMVRRVSWLAAHHHTYGLCGDTDYQILLEADYLANAGESGYGRSAVFKVLERGVIFKTDSGKKLLLAMYPEE